MGPVEAEKNILVLMDSAVQNIIFVDLHRHIADLVARNVSVHVMAKKDQSPPAKSRQTILVVDQMDTIVLPIFAALDTVGVVQHQLIAVEAARVCLENVRNSAFLIQIL
jgi:hypothetical protein